MQYKTVAIPEILREHVEFITIGDHDGASNLATDVYLNALPGIVFQHHNGLSPVESITTASGSRTNTPTLFVYGQMTEPNVVRYKQQPFTATTIFLKPHALQSLLGVNAALLTNDMVDLGEFSVGDLNMRLLEAPNEQARLALLIDFLVSKLNRVTARDRLIEESLRIIHSDVSRVTVKQLFECLNLSERQFEKRFIQAVGLTPQFYIRIKRFNEVVRLMQTRQFETLTALAHHLNYYDQSHFVRDIKSLSGMTPKNLYECYTREPLSTTASLYFQEVDAVDERDGFLQF